MALRVPVEGETRMLEAILNHRLPQDLELRLYANERTPTVGDTVEDYVELIGGGYQRKPLMGREWLIEPGERSVATYPEQAWTFTGAIGLVYGYVVVQARSVVLMWAERFPDGPYRIEHRGDVIRMTPRLTLEGR